MESAYSYTHTHINIYPASLTRGVIYADRVRDLLLCSAEPLKGSHWHSWLSDSLIDSLERCVPLHNSHAHAATGAPLRASQQQASTHARAPFALCLCFAVQPGRREPFCLHNNNHFRPSRLCNLHNIPTSLLSICLLVRAIA